MPDEDPKPDSQSLKDLVSNAFFGMDQKDLNPIFQSNFRTVYTSILDVFDNPERIILNIQNGSLTPDQKTTLDILVDNSPEEFIETFITEYVNVFLEDADVSDLSDLEEKFKEYPDGLDFKGVINNAALSTGAKQRGYQIFFMIEEYRKYKRTENSILGDVDPFNYIKDALNKVGGGLEPAFEYLQLSLKDVMLRNMGKFRDDTIPASVAPWQCRIGASTFFVPPTSISVSQMFKAGSFAGAAIRQPNSPKFNTGHSETTIEMTLFFPNHETIWGFLGERAEFNWDPSNASTGGVPETSDEEIDFFLSSLRGLVTQFKYAPFLPVRNQYLNQAHDIHAVTMLGMNVQTMPEYPFCLVVNLQMAKFNHKVYMPMIEDFDQAFHWGKFRQYMGRAATRLDSIVNQGFLTKKDPPSQSQIDQDEIDWVRAGRPDDWKWTDTETVVVYDGELVPYYDKSTDIRDGRFFEMYIPRSTPSRLFVPDTTDFRQPGENEVITSEKWNGILSFIGINAVDRPNFNFFEYDVAIRNFQVTTERVLVRNWMQLQKLTWERMGSSQLNAFVNGALDEAVKSGAVNPDTNPGSYEALKNGLRFNWFLEIYDQYLQDPFFKKKIEQQKYENGDYLINEWKVPMEKVTIDWNSCIVQGVSVSLSNSIARLQVQMQDEPVHQHIGGGDSTVNVSMMVVGEENLIRFRRLFEYIGGLARLEHGHGVLGFLGIKNIVTSLCGIKYVIPLSFEVDTVPNYPHIYQVRMSFVDFDIFQQKREQLSSQQQKDLIEAFGKRNPFLRIKQKWGAFNAYPDMPLEVRDEDNNVAGHLDPDWYFRSFTNNDRTTYEWANDTDITSKLAIYNILSKNAEQIKQAYPDNYDAIVDYRQQLQREIREMLSNGTSLPDGWTFDDRGNIVSDGSPPKPRKDGVPLRYYMGTLSEDQNKLYYIEQTQAGAVVLGSQDVATGKDDDPFLSEHAFVEDLASRNVTQSSTPSGTPLNKYQSEYWNGGTSPTAQFEAMMKDWNYRQLDGRMIRAFPTYMLWLIDEGGRFAGIKLFDNFYGLNSVIDFSVVQSEDSIEDTLILRVSNLFQRLSTPYKDAIIGEDDPLLDTPIGKVISVFENRTRNLKSGLLNEIVELNNIRLKPGVRVHLRAGYGASPNSLQTIFNGVITEVQQGDIMTVVAQSDAVELTAQVNTSNKKGHSGTLDGGINTGFWLSEPRDLMVRLLSMGSSAFKEWVSWGTQGTIFSENRFGIRHFGSILYEPMTDGENTASLETYYLASKSITIGSATQGASQDQFATSLGDITKSVGQLNFGSFSSILNGSLIAVMEAMWVNSFKKRDYEIFKRNIYPGNGLGIGQYMAGDMIDAGVLVSTMTSSISEGNVDPNASSANNNGAPTAAQVAEENLAIIDAAKAGLGLSSEDDTALLGLINNNEFVAPEIQTTDPFGDGGPSIGGIINGFFDAVDVIDKYTNPLRWASWGFDKLGVSVPGMDTAIAITDSVSVGSVIDRQLAIPKMAIRFAQSPIGQLFGLTSVMEDDDLPGYAYDEVSFRAQTYMKSVWDLFRLCAALLPNYIVAVRPFEDRSTVFYGKPHWLYTSGVIPVSTGVKPDDSIAPQIEKASSDYELLSRIAQQNSSSFEALQRQLSDLTSLDRQSVGTTENINAAGYIEKITTAPEAIADLPTEWDNGAFIPMTEGRVSTEMHLPAVGESVSSKTGHNQLPDLPTEMKWPYYMDRTAGDGAGGRAPWVDSRGYAQDWGGGEKIVGSTGSTVGNEDPNAPGQSGSWGLLPADVEQWYISSFWPWENESQTAKFASAGEKYAPIYQKAIDRKLKKDDYKYKKVLVYSPITKLAVVCGVGEWGPNPGFKESENGIPFICGISPDATHYLGVTRGDNVVLRAMGDDVPYGPYSTGSGIANAVIDMVNQANADVSGNKPADVAVNPATGDSFNTSVNVDNTSVQAWIDSVSKSIDSQRASAKTIEEKNSYDKAKEMLEKDPLVFAYHFGWKYSAIPAYIDPQSGIGTDVVGTAAAQIYNEDVDGSLKIAPGDGKSIGQAQDIWEDFRAEYPVHTEPQDIYLRHFPLTESADKYLDVMEMFLRFMWQVPSNRAWLVNNAERVGESTVTTVIDSVTDHSVDVVTDVLNAPIGLLPGSNPLEPAENAVDGALSVDVEGDMLWDWSFVNPVWETFIGSGDVFLDEGGTPYSPSARAYMQSHNVDGTSAGNAAIRTAEDIKGWWDDNIGQFIGLVGDVLSGFLSMLRISMMQIGIGLSLAGTMQRQANTLNAIFNDSIYYREGDEGSLLRMVDNPFTREYGEPVIEIREPFQRIHFLSSFQHILSNNISENINGVPTVVTATSDGKYPVTVHFDKGMSPEKQTEVAVDTGLFWDNAMGSGITGIFQPLIHPIEALRSVAKTATASSDLLSSKRVALWHLKEGLKDIYTGELTVLGNADIRAHDLIYLADVYERMYGMFEVEKVIHHFTPESGFVTSIVPNAIVTINDPGRWSLIAWAWRKFSEYNIRSDTRAMLAVRADRNAALVSAKGLDMRDVPEIFSTQLLGATQYTQGNTALIRDFSAMYSMGGMQGLTYADELTNNMAKIDQNLTFLKGGLTLGGGVIGGLTSGPTGIAVGGVGGYAIGDLLWKAWGWVRDNLLDQHGCYIQFLNKDGQPLDAGLSYAQGVAVGQHHSISLFPNILGIDTGDVTIKDGDNYRITTNDLLSAMGWTEIETAYIQRQTSWFVDQINSEVLKVAGRTPDPIVSDQIEVIMIEALEPYGETVDGDYKAGVIDGDTFYARVIDSQNPKYANGKLIKVRLAAVNTKELTYKQIAGPAVDETNYNLPNDLALLATRYLQNKFSIVENRVMAMRLPPENQTSYDRTVGVIFDKIPPTTSNISREKRIEILKALAQRDPVIPWDAYMEDGRPYTLNWELVMAGYGNVDMRDSLWSAGRDDQISSLG